jgi:glycine cleavage system transcriptional repressor
MTVEQFVALSALGPDRAGLVAELTEYITTRGGNIEDSRMAILGAEFGILMLISAGADGIARAERDLAQLEAQTGMKIALRKTVDPTQYRKAAARPCEVLAESLDREGIVHSIAATLHKLQVNIVSMQTVAYNAPISGSPLFRLEATVDVPQDLPMSRLREALDALARAENIDVSIRQVGQAR